MRYNFDEFFKLDKESQISLLVTHKIDRIHTEINMYDNDDKTVFFSKQCSIATSSRGDFYKKSSLESYIIYHKKTKKCYVKNANNIIELFFKHYNFNHYLYDHNSLFRVIFIKKLTATFCKKVIEGKMNTINDLIKYYKSYVVRDKNADEKIIYQYLIRGCLNLYHKTSDREKIFDIPATVDLKEYFPYEMIEFYPYTISIDKYEDARRIYEDWRETIISKVKKGDYKEDDTF